MPALFGHSSFPVPAWSNEQRQAILKLMLSCAPLLSPPPSPALPSPPHPPHPPSSLLSLQTESRFGQFLGDLAGVAAGTKLFDVLAIYQRPSSDD